MKKLCFIAVSLLVISFACGPDMKSDSSMANNALVYYSSDEWPLSCYYYDPHSRDFGQNLPLWNQAWVWAKTPEGAHVHAKGHREGGFLVANEIYYSKGTKIFGKYIDVPGSELMSDIKTADDIERLCQQSIDREYPNKGYKLIGIVGSRNTSTIANLIENAFPLAMGENLSKNKITRVVIFGDSLSDTGRLKRWIQVMPERPFFLGRFSNGGVWSDFISKQADLAIVNYATGGAVTKGDISRSASEVLNYVKDVGRFFITGSLRNFIKDYKNNELSGGAVPNADRTLFVIWGGANDFLSRFDHKQDINTLIDKADTPDIGSNAIIEQAVLNLVQDIRGLISIGARNIMVANLPDIGVTPRMAMDNKFRNNTPEDKYALSQAMSKIINKYNQELAAKITQLQGAGGAKIALFDAAGALKSLMEAKGPNGESNFDYGIDMNASFTKLSSPGNPDIKVGRRCYTGSYLGSTNLSDICPGSARMLFWDEVHPTAIGHCGLAFFIHKLLYQQGWVSTPPSFAEYRSNCR